MSKTLKRILTLALALAMLIGYLPGITLPTRAVDAVTNDASLDALTALGLGVEWTDLTPVTAGQPVGTTEWSVDGTAIKNVTDQLVGKKQAKTILTLKNNLPTEAHLNFKWDAAKSGANTYAGSDVTFTQYDENGNKVAEEVWVKQSTLTQNGEKDIVLSSGAYVTFTITVAAVGSRQKAHKVTLNVLDLNLYVDKNVSTTFAAVDPAQGSYTVNGEAITATKTFEQKAAEAYAVVATPAAGYVFSGWYSETTDAYLAMTAEAELLLDTNQTVYPKFIKEQDAVWTVGSAYFDDLNTAIYCAQRSSVKVVTLQKDHTLTGEYVIPQGVVVLVPFNDAGTCYTTTPSPIPELDLDGDGNLNPPAAWQTPYAYRTLTLAENARLVVKGGLSISAQHHGGGQTTAGAPSGPCGFLVTQKGSKITVENGGGLYAWGYVVGEGEVEALSGAAVYENMQFTDFRGGSASSQFVNTDSNLPEELLERYVVFPFTQYYVQNVEVPLTIHSGAKEVVQVTIYAGGKYVSIPVDFIGTSKAMFRMEDGAYITKAYDGATDRLVISVEGDVSLNGMTAVVPGFTGEEGMDSSMFNLPINSNITINVNSGTTTINQNVALLPGAVVNIAKNATMFISDGWNIYIYDRDEWVDFAGYTYVAKMDENGQPVLDENDLPVYEKVLVSGHFVHPNVDLKPICWTYANGRKVVRTSDSLLDAKINVNGVLEAYGFIYTTQSGANIYSSEGTGVVLLWSGAGFEENTYQAIQSNTTITFVAIPLVPAQLMNADGGYTSTAAGDMGFIYNAATGMWESVVVVHFDGNGGTGSTEDVEVPAVDVAVPEDEYGVYNIIILPDCGFERPGYQFMGWCTTADGTGERYNAGDSFAVTENVTLYAIWEVDENYEFQIYIEGYDTPVGATYGENLSGLLDSLEIPVKEGYTFAGWVITDAAGNVYTGTTMPAFDIYITATWDEAYTIIFKDGDDEISSEQAVSGNDYYITIPDNAKEGYILLGWATTAGGDVVYTPGEYVQFTSNTTLYAVWQAEHVCGDPDTLVEYEKQDAECETAGHEAYWICSCGKVYADAAATTEIVDLTAWLAEGGEGYIAPLDHGHTEGLGYTANYNNTHNVYCKDCGLEIQFNVACAFGGDHVCDFCGATERMTIIFMNGDEEWTRTECEYNTTLGIAGMPVPEAPAGYKFVGWYTANGVHVYHGMIVTSNMVAYANWERLHVCAENLTETRQKDAGCIIPGHKAYWSCSCGKYYADAEATTEITDLDAWLSEGGDGFIGATGHSAEAQYLYKNENLHTVYYACCGASSVACHTSDVDGHCECPAVVVKLMMRGNEPTFWLEPGKTAAIEIGTNENYWLYYFFPHQRENTSGFMAGTEALFHLPADLMTAQAIHEIFVYEAYKGRVNLNGGTLTSEAVAAIQKMGLAVTDTYFEQVYSVGAINTDIEDVVVKNGCTMVGIKLNGTVYDVDDYMTITKDFVLDIIWKCSTEHANTTCTVSGETHTITCDDCGEVLSSFEGHHYDETAHKCICGEIEQFLLTVYNNYSGLNREIIYQGYVPYGAALSEMPFVKEFEEIQYIDNNKFKAKLTFYGWFNRNEWSWYGDENQLIMPAYDLILQANFDCVGWESPDNGRRWAYWDGSNYLVDWAEVNEADYTENGTGTAWYYFSDQIYYLWSICVTGLTQIEGEYFLFAEDGKWMNTFTGVYTDVDGKIYYIKEGKAVADQGLVRVYENGEALYYYFVGYNAITSADHNANGMYWVKNTNGLLPAWDYTFGADGIIAHDDALNNSEDAKHQIAFYEGKKFYTIDGIKVHYGLFVGDGELLGEAGAYYYARSTGELVCGQVYWISETHINGVTYNGQILTEGNYTFDAEGRIVWPDVNKDGIYAEDGGLYYYVDGVRTYAGLIEIDGDYYYVRTSGQLATGTYWITKTNNLKAEGSYTFGEDGKMILNGIVDGYYYVNGVRTYAGLIEIDGDYYYVRTNGAVVTNCSYWITKTNNLMKAARYEFDAEGKMIRTTGIVEEDGKLYYYENGLRTYAGLIEIDGKYYYVRTSGELAIGYYWITKTNYLMEDGRYLFGEDGAMIIEN